MPVKILGLFAIFFVCTAAGLLKSYSLKKRVNELETFSSSFRDISIEIRYFATPTDVIISKLNEIKAYKSLRVFATCKESLEQTRNFSQSWNDAVDKALPYLSLDKEDAGIIKRFGDSFGTTDVEGQIANCEQYSLMLDDRLQIARDDKKKRGKMFSSLGILAGVFLTIFFI